MFDTVYPSNELEEPGIKGVDILPLRLSVKNPNTSTLLYWIHFVVMSDWVSLTRCVPSFKSQAGTLFTVLDESSGLPNT